MRWVCLAANAARAVGRTSVNRDTNRGAPKLLSNWPMPQVSADWGTQLVSLHTDPTHLDDRQEFY